MKTYKEFITEAKVRPSQRASKRGVVSKRKPKDERPEAHILIGPPGSGKSTLVKRMQQVNPNVTQAELDQSRKELGKSPKHFGRDIMQHQSDVISKAKENRNPIVVSNTSIPKKHREALKTEIGNEYNTKEILVPTSLKAALRRNRKRPESSVPGKGRVPEFVMRNMARQMGGVNVRPNTGGALSRADKRAARRYYKKLHRKYRFTIPNMQRIIRNSK